MIVKIVLLFLLTITLIWAGDISSQIDKLNQKIPYASKSETKDILHQLENLYISAVISGKNAYIAKALRGIIRCQKLLHIDPSTYEKELQSLHQPSTKTEKKKPQHIKKEQKRANNKPQVTSKALYIRSIQSKENSIIMKFDRAITKEDLFFFKIKTKDAYKHIYDIRANLNFKTPSLDIRGVKSIKIAQNRKDKVRIVLQDSKMLYSKAFIRKGTLFITINQHKQKTAAIAPAKKRERKSVAPKKHLTPPVIKKSTKKSSSATIYASSKTIVIDAGHGGYDSGAVGYKKYKEKQTVYKVSKLLKQLLEKKGYNVYMTREKDTFVKLKNRTHLANKKNADLFISIHANAAPKGKYLSLKGIETFFLSPAKTAKAKRIAAKENAAASAMNKKSQDTLLSFLNRNKIIQSNKLAIDIQSGLLSATRKKFKGVKDGGVREAPFWVLVGAQMPAVLIELGYITNPIEGERLFNPFYQKALAKGIFNGINNYFANNK
jgi:N-acetylmuramoyl-L-alanine amidase